MCQSDETSRLPDDVARMIEPAPEFGIEFP